MPEISSGGVGRKWWDTYKKLLGFLPEEQPSLGGVQTGLHTDEVLACTVISEEKSIEDVVSSIVVT